MGLAQDAARAGEPRPVPRRSLVAKRDAYRRVILDCAEELFAADGVDGTRIETIAQAAGVAPRTLYTVFASKQEIVDAVSERRRADLLVQARERVAAAHGPLDALVLTVRASNEFFLAYPDYLRLELRESRAWSVEGPSQTWHEAFAAYSGLFRRAMDERTVRPGEPTAFARALLALQQSQLAHWVAAGMPSDHRRVVEDIESLLLHAFASDAGLDSTHRIAAGDRHRDRPALARATPRRRTS